MTFKPLGDSEQTEDGVLRVASLLDLKVLQRGREMDPFPCLSVDS